ncbi:pentapeptide repeat-containing protein [Streptomyces sp. NPDC020807]|uniref:pentapeptide repeat-containing protein n=1 Tax=unclassified Streptomyces TaxID=2593676 RepID=UPI0033E6036C
MKKLAWRTLLVLLSVGALIGLGLLLLRGPWWFDGDHLLDKNLQPAAGVVVTGFRTTLVALGVAVTAGIGLVYTHRNFEHTREKDREQAEMTREGQVTGRYVEAIKLLAARDSAEEGPRVMERLGGIYALERIMRDSEKDHDTVVQVLAAFVRQQAALPDPDLPDPGDQIPRPGPKEDVQAALRVLGRRPNRVESQRLDLSFTALWRVDLSGARLEGADLFGAELHHADLRYTDLKGAELGAVELEDAELAHADLRGANLAGRLNIAAKLEVDQLLQAVFDKHTKLPLHLAHKPEVKKALEA